jgi:hypothetical protein
MKIIDDYNNLQSEKIYYINVKGYIINDNLEGPQPEYPSKEILEFVKMENDFIGLFVKHMDNISCVFVKRNLELYDIYEPENEHIINNVICRKIFKEKFIQNTKLDNITINMLSNYIFPSPLTKQPIYMV